MNWNRKALFLFFSVCLVLVPTGKAALALVVTESRGVIKLDGDNNGTLAPFAVDIMDTFGSPMDFGFVQDGVPSTIDSTSTSSGTAKFSVGQVVDFAKKSGISIFSISDSVKDFGYLTFEVPVTEGKLNPTINTYFNSLTIDWIELNLGIPRLISTTTSLNARGTADEFAPVHISPVTLLIGAGLIGLIGIARRSFFTK